MSVLEFTEEDLRHAVTIAATIHRPRVTPAVVLARVANHYRVPLLCLTAEDRTRVATIARHVGMYLLRRRCELSSTEIGNLLCRDHTSVLYGVKRVTRLRETSERVARDLWALEKSFV